MNAVLRHRGPDDRGVYADDRAMLAQTRLSIIDLSPAGHQPMGNEDGQVWVTFNGEIYNFLDLVPDLQQRGHRFRSRCDTEVILHAYEELGPACVLDFRGMFAFAVWDKRRRQAWLARDRLGVKPLYYYADDRRLVFASEIKAILEAPGVPRTLRPDALQDYLTYLYVPAPKTMFQGIHKLPQGHWLVYRDGRVTIERYWDVEFGGFDERSAETIGEEFLSQFREAVRLRLISDVPLGAFLSGGLDSSSVVALMAGLSPEPVITNSIGFEEEKFDELAYADDVARRFGTDHHRCRVRPEAAEVVEKLAWHYDEPFGDSSAIPTYYLSKMARQNVTVALSGDGGDENMAGYSNYTYRDRVRKVRRCLPEWVSRQLFGSLARIYPRIDSLPRVLRANTALTHLSLSDEQSHFRAMAFGEPAGAQRLLHGDVLTTLDGYSSFGVLKEHFDRTDATDPLTRSLYVDIKTYLCDDVLVKVDRASMAVALEVRGPLLDHKFIEFMARIPPSLKLRNGRGKYLFKNVMRPIIGGEITDRRKMGFSVPLGDWFRGPLKGMFEDLLFSPSAWVQDCVDLAEVRRVWQAHQSGIHLRGRLFWALLMLEHWARRFLRRDVPARPGSER